MKRDSFTRKVKEELVSNSYDSFDRLRALLAAYIRINGSLIIRNKSTVLSLKNENAKISKFLYETISQIYKTKVNLLTKKKPNLSKSVSYIIEIEEASEEIIDDLEISFVEGKISKNIVRNDDTISGYLAGAFLASGSINSPVTSNYHLEISLNNDNFAKWLSKLFAKYKNSNIEPKIIKRRENYVIYFKKCDQISTFLIMIGAVSSCLEFEDVRVTRDSLNTANRLVNMDTANMKRTLETGQRQVSEIQLINQKLGLDNIQNVKARELAKARLENESASLVELADILGHQLAKPITKSNVNHLFRYLHELYLRLNKWQSKNS